MDMRPLGIFDSGVGGLTILKAIQSSLPYEHLLFFADQAHVPYGPRTMQEIRSFSLEITRFLLNEGAKMIVVACNTASGYALQYLRDRFPGTPIIGLEPAIAPAVRITRSGRIAVLATEATLKGRLYLSTRDRFCDQVTIFEATLEGIVEEIEADRITGERTQMILKDTIAPLIDKRVDSIVLGCTHYPFLTTQIREIAGPDVNIIDPSDQIAAYIARTLNRKDLAASRPSQTIPVLFSTRDAQELARIAESLAGLSGNPSQVTWKEGQLSKS